jgi:hypothetical protein
MTRKKEEATAGLRRGRTLATAGLGAATLIGGLVYAMPANAATPTNPTVTLKVDSQIANDGTTAANLSIEVNNKQTGNADIDFAALKLTLTMPAGIDCSSDVTVAAVGGEPALSTTSTGATCVFTSSGLSGPAFAADSDTTESYTVTVDGQRAATPTSPAQLITGAVTGVAELDANTSGGDFNGVLATSNTASSNLVTPGPATLANTAAPVANYGQNYSFQVVTSPGFPATSPNAAAASGDGYSALGIENTTANRTSPPANATVTRGANAALDVTTGTGTTATHDYYISLNDDDLTATGDQTGFFFDTVSGKIVYGTAHLDTVDQTKNTFVASAPTGLSAVNFDPKYTWVIVANNGTGTSAAGASFGLTGIASGLTVPTAGDVASAASSLDVGFSDVSSTSPFLNDIDTLARNGVINGYINGTYGPKQSVNREQFVAFAARLYALTQAGGSVTDYNGACNATVDPSQFTDVPNNNQFCKAIQQMASLGVVNGYTATTFGPNKIVQRQEIAAFLVRLAEAINNSPVTDLPKASTGFTDVPKSSIFSGDINWLVGNKITKGATATTFAPHADALRQEVAAFVNRFAGTLATNPLV